jgi:hypothetical protein
MTRMTGRAALSSATSASICSAMAPVTSVPRSVAASPRSMAAMALRRALAPGCRTFSASRKGSNGSSWPSSSPVPRNTWGAVSDPSAPSACGAVALAMRAPTSVDLPIPGSPSISTALPAPRARSRNRSVSRDSSFSRPTRAPTGVTGGMPLTVPVTHTGSKQNELGHEFGSFDIRWSAPPCSAAILVQLALHIPLNGPMHHLHKGSAAISWPFVWNFSRILD